MAQRNQETMNPETWLEEHGDVMFSHAYKRVGDKGIAEDLVQEALLGAMKGKDSFRGDATVRTWLIGILKYKILDHLRAKYKKQESNTEHLDEIFDASGKWKSPPANWKTDPTQHLHSEEFRHILKACLDDLPDSQRTALVLRAFNDVSTDELCNLLEVSTTNLGVMLHRSRHQLRACLEEHWFRT